MSLYHSLALYIRTWLNKDTGIISLNDVFLQLSQEIIVRGKRKMQAKLHIWQVLKSMIYVVNPNPKSFQQ